MQGLGSGALSLAGAPALRARYLPRVARGEAVAAFALSEPEAGSDVAAMTCSARSDGDHYVLDGTKTWISNGGLADHYVVFARTGEGTGSKGLSAFVVDSDTQGLKVVERISLSAPHPLATLAFKDCRVPVTARLGVPGEGFKIAMATLDVFRTSVGAAALGFARRALHEMVEHAATRKLFGAPLGELQLTQAAIADSARAQSQRIPRRRLERGPCYDRSSGTTLSTRGSSAVMGRGSQAANHMPLRCAEPNHASSGRITTNDVPRHDNRHCKLHDLDLHFARCPSPCRRSSSRCWRG
jgi:hypothetical protein